MPLLNPFEPPGSEPSPSTPAYTTRPQIASITPSSDRIAGGTSVTIVGDYFGFGGNVTVTFGGVSATAVVVVNQQTITCTVPAHAIGAVDVVVTNANGQSYTFTAGFTYVSSVLLRVVPPSGLYTGGTAVTLMGTGFVAGSSITFGGVAATSVVYVSATRYTCVSPAGTSGTSVDVTITEPGGASSTKTHSFLYSKLVLSSPFNTLYGGPNTSPIRRAPSVNIQTQLGNAPNTCTFSVGGEYTMPQVNDDISFIDNGILKFAGTITEMEQTYEDAAVNDVYHVNATDYSWQLNRILPKGVYKNVAISGILTDLVSRYASGFSLTIGVSTYLTNPVTVTYDGRQNFMTVLSDLCARAGDVHWKVDYNKVIHVFDGSDASLTSPTALVDGLSTLMNDPAPRVTTDLTQIRNRVTVVGAGTSVVTDPLPSLYPNGSVGVVGPVHTDYGIIPVASVLGFGTSGGTMMIGGVLIRYNSVGTSIPTGNTAVVDTTNCPYIVVNLEDLTQILKIIQLNNSTPGYPYYYWPPGTQVAPAAQQDDSESISEYGVHEYTLQDSNIQNYADCVSRAIAELAKFAKPIVRISYTSRDEKTTAGATLSVSLAHPQVSGTFVIQSVTIDQYYDEADALTVRYNVTAELTNAAARFTYTDFLLYLDKTLNQPGTGQQPIAATPPAAAAATVTVPAQNIQTVTFTLTAAQVNSLNTSPYTAINAPGSGNIILGVAAYGWQNVTTTFSVLNNMAFRWASFASGQDLCSLFSFTNGPNTSALVSKQQANFSFTANKDPRNQPVIFYATGDCTGGGTSTFTITLLYTIVTM